MSTSRLTFGAVLSTIQTSANTVTATLDAANQGVGMLTAYVSEAASNQRVRQIADREVFLENLIREKAEERSAANIKVQKFCAQSSDHKSFYEASYATFTNLLRTPQSA